MNILGNFPLVFSYGIPGFLLGAFTVLAVFIGFAAREKKECGRIENEKERKNGRNN